jgi:Amt family ammonium transporter
VTTLNGGDTVWLLVSTTLVLFMTPGLALFYGGMVRTKSALAMMAQVLGALAVVSIVWALLGYTLAFGVNTAGGLVGNLHFAGLAHTHEPVPGLHLTVPPLSFATFQMMFAAITAALLAGAGADRMRFFGFLTLCALWVLVVYAPIAHWVFSPEGWLAHRGVLDFAGGTVVEANSGASALALALVLKPRRGWRQHPMPPHSLPLTLTGAGILWFGWFGFNAGSALSSGDLAALALVNTHLAACAGLLGWILVERRRTGRGTTLGAASGAVAGLVGITPAAGYVSTMPAVLIGLVAGMIAALAVEAKFRLGYDDSLDVVGVHGVCGIVGMIGVGLLATRIADPAIEHQGLFTHGGPRLLGVEFLAVVVTVAWAFVVTWLLAKLVERTVGLRVAASDEAEGLDQTVHAESAYDLGGVHGSGRLGA